MYNESMTVYIPFGPSCEPAILLKYIGLRTQSLPFDWLFAYPEHIKRSLDQDFNDWFDQNKLELCTRNETNELYTKHSNYPVKIQKKDNEFNVGFFNHFDMTNIDRLNITKKRIERFKNIIASDEDIVFVTFSTEQEFEVNGLISYFDRPVSFVFIDWKISNKISFNYSQKINNIYINCSSPTHTNDSIFKNILNTLTSHAKFATII